MVAISVMVVAAMDHLGYPVRSFFSFEDSVGRRIMIRMSWMCVWKYGNSSPFFGKLPEKCGICV